MKTHRTSSGPFAERPYFSDSDIDTICLEELNAQGLLPSTPAAVRIDRFIEKRFGKSHTYADLADGVLGLTTFGSRGVQEIVLARCLEDDQSKPSERRLRSTLAHEVGHALLHAYLFVLGQQKPLLGDWSDKSKPKVLCRDSGLHTGYKGDWWEYQANMVMGSILMPKHLVQQAIQPYLQSLGSLGLQELTPADRSVAIRRLAETFDVNPALARIRLEKIVPTRSAGQLTL